jgi:hypothetical protein
MAKAYYSNVFSQSADHIWNVIRDFNNYPVWVDGAGESHIEEGKSGDAAGAVRNVIYQGKNIRQTLLAVSDIDRSRSYEFCGEPPMPVRHYRANLKVIPPRATVPSSSGRLRSIARRSVRTSGPFFWRFLWTLAGLVAAAPREECVARDQEAAEPH